MSVTIVQTAFGGVTNVSTSGGSVLFFFNFSSAPAAGNTIVLCVDGINIHNNLILTTPSDSAGDSFSSLVAESVSFPDSFGNTVFAQAQIYIANLMQGGAGSTTLDIGGTSSPNVSGLVYCAYEIAGLGVNPLDATARGGSAVFPAGASITPGRNGTLALSFVCAVASQSAGVFSTAGSGWTLDPPGFETATLFAGGSNSDLIGDGAQHQFLATNAPVSGALTRPTSGNGWVSVAATLGGTAPIGGGNGSWLTVELNNSLRGVRH